jgi:hypothetical protein
LSYGGLMERSWFSRSSRRACIGRSQAATSIDHRTDAIVEGIGLKDRLIIALVVLAGLGTMALTAAWVMSL